jgi:Flp pilus assembly protein TadD
MRFSLGSIILAVPLTLVSLAGVSAQPGEEVAISVRRLSDRVAVFDIRGPQATHITTFRSGRGVVVVDTEVSPVFARALRARIEAERKRALERLRAMAADSTRYYTLHPELDTFAYRMMTEGKVEEALRIFRVLTELFPGAWMAWDSLGEALLRREDRTGAIAAFEKSLALNPDNDNAIRRLKEIKKGV